MKICTINGNDFLRESLFCGEFRAFARRRRPGMDLAGNTGGSESESGSQARLPRSAKVVNAGSENTVFVGSA